MPEQWKCSKCGAEAISKCPSQRSVFPSDQRMAIFSNVFDVESRDQERDPYVQRTISLSYRQLLAGAEEEAEFDVNFMIDRLASILSTPEGVASFKGAFCYHDWEIQYGECTFGCHKSPNPEPVEV